MASKPPDTGIATVFVNTPITAVGSVIAINPVCTPQQTGSGTGSAFVDYPTSPCVSIYKSCQDVICIDATIDEEIVVCSCGSVRIVNINVTDSLATITCPGTALPPYTSNCMTCLPYKHLPGYLLGEIVGERWVYWYSWIA